MKLNYVFLFLSDPLDSRIPDVEYEKEYKVASKYFSVGLINQERLFEDNVITITYKISNDDIIIYRGWMLKPQLYDRLVTYVEKNGAKMFTNLSEYDYTHLIPNWVKDNSNHVKTNRKINLSTEDKKVIMDAPKEVKAKFYTIDFARKSNGKLVIMEMGDGQVSGLQGFDEQKFYDLLWENLPESRA